MRDKYGRYIKKQNIVFDIPSLSSLIRYLILIFIFAPWVYIFIYKFEITVVIEEALSFLFGPRIINKNSDCKSKETPY